MDIKCPSCLSIFRPKELEKSRINNAIEKGQKLLMMDCPVCYKSIPINPTGLIAVREKDVEEAIECPICNDGIISYIDDGMEVFWGCGECGNVWHSKKELDNAIRNIKH